METQEPTPTATPTTEPTPTATPTAAPTPTPTATTPPTRASYRDAVLTDSPAGYWRLGETTGTVAGNQVASSGAGTYLDGVSLGQPGALFGDADTSAGFDGSNDTVVVPDAGALNPTGAITVECWVRPGTLSTSTTSVVRKDGQYMLRIRNDGSAVFRLWKSGTAYEVITPAGAVPGGQWTHLVGTWNGTTMILYVNGSAGPTRALAGPSSAGTQALYIGSAYEYYDYFPGGIDEVAVYPAALSPARVQAHYDAASNGDQAAPKVTLHTPAGASTMDATPHYGGLAGTATADATARRSSHDRRGLSPLV